MINVQLTQPAPKGSQMSSYFMEAMLDYCIGKDTARVAPFAAESRGLLPTQISGDYVIGGGEVFMMRYSPSNIKHKPDVDHQLKGPKNFYWDGTPADSITKDKFDYFIGTVMQDGREGEVVPVALGRVNIGGREFMMDKSMKSPQMRKFLDNIN